jgi:allantoicase
MIKFGFVAAMTLPNIGIKTIRLILWIIKKHMSNFTTKFVNLASPKLGAKMISATDDSFAPKERLIQDHDAVWIEDKYDDYGKWMDGWESKRRRDGGHDWAVLKLGTQGIIKGVDIDTSHFTGNYPPGAMIEASLSENEPDEGDWFTLVEPTTLGPSAHHLVEVSYDKPINWLRLHMLPDGGIARLRVYGEPYCEWDKQDADAIHELSLMVNGGRVVAYNDAHYGKVWAILTEGRGENMGDGWETRRRREPGNDWIIIALGAAGHVDHIEVDTAFYKGNFPDRCSIHAARVEMATDKSLVTQSMFWEELMGEQKLSADSIHRFEKDKLNDLGPITHLRLNIFPDGGISRLRVFGKLAQ